MRFGIWVAACLLACTIAVLFMSSRTPLEDATSTSDLVNSGNESSEIGASGSGAGSGTSESRTTDSGTSESSSSRSVSATQEPVNRKLTKVNRAVPSFTLQGIDNSTWTENTLTGKPWVINFWASWCAPCIEEIPSMNAAYEILEPQGIGMLAINAGEGGDTVNEFLEKVAIDFPNVLGGTNTLQNWSVRGLPTTIIVTADGEVLYEALGPREWDDEQLLQRVVDSL